MLDLGDELSGVIQVEDVHEDPGAFIVDVRHDGAGCDGDDAGEQRDDVGMRQVERHLDEPIRSLPSRLAS